MKFLCIECDEAMKLTETRGPEQGSLTAVFTCPSCGRGTAMLTNAMETQMVRSLDVKIGGRSVPAEPMETLRGTLTNQQDITPAETSAPPAAAATNGEAESSGGSKCPFSGMVSEAMEQQEDGLKWTPEAEARLERIPTFVRAMVRKSIEQHAEEKGYTEINEEVMDEMKSKVGMSY